jgi:hypothetical protein
MQPNSRKCNKMLKACVKSSTPAVEGKVVGGTGRRSGQGDLSGGGEAADLGLDISRLHGAVERQEVRGKAGNVAATELATRSIMGKRLTGWPWKSQR